jgi:hypothetical protein
MRQDEPTRPVKVPRLRTATQSDPTPLPLDDERLLRRCVDRETEPLPKLDG